MKLGLNTNCLRGRDLSGAIEFAGKHGFSHIEVMANPLNSGSGVFLDVEKMDGNGAERIGRILDENGVRINCLSYYANMFMPVNGDSEYHEGMLRKVIDGAGLLKVDKVSMFTGFSLHLSISENVDRLEKMIRPVLEYASGKNVRLMLENTPLMSGEELGGNFAYCPELWDVIFTRIPDENFGLNYDPSHLYWLGIDYSLFLSVFADRIFQVQACDSEILVEKLRMTGIFGNDWFRSRIPGYGAIDWKKFFSALYEAGFDGVISLENKDPVWLSDDEKVEKGIMLGKKFLETFLI